MSGIVGIFQKGDRNNFQTGFQTGGRVFDEEAIRRMLAAISFRGPDAQGTWASGTVALGNCERWTTPESRIARLPLIDEAAEIVLVADARIDNRGELIRLLGLSDRRSAEVADCTLILAAYLKWGPACPVRLLGDFAFAIWDSRNRRLFCARDIVGAKPFFYNENPETVWFASEIKSLLTIPEIPQRLNEFKLVDSLVPIVTDMRATCYEGIVRLEPAHSMIVDSSGVKTTRYYEPDPTRVLQLKSDGEYEEAFQEVFGDAVRCRLRTANHVGSTLSGGLDSSTVACTARRALPRSTPLHTFSAVFPTAAEHDSRIDETQYIDAVLAGGDYTSHLVYADRSQPLSDLLEIQDEEFLPAPSLYMGKAILAEARQNNVGVVLSGFDGDVVVSYGYEFLVDLARKGMWKEFASGVQALAERQGHADLGHYFRPLGLPALSELAKRGKWVSLLRNIATVPTELGYSRRRLWRHVAAAAVPDSVSRLSSRLFGKSTDERTSVGLNRALNPRFAARTGVVERWRMTSEVDRSGDLRRVHADAFCDGQFEYVTAVYDRMGAHAGVEQRYPFLDRRVMEFCLAVPFDQRFRDGWTRSLLRRSMEGVLPAEVQWRATKGNLGSNLRLRLATEAPLVQELLGSRNDPAWRFLDQSAAVEAFNRFSANPTGSSEEDLFTVFLAASLVRWLQERRFEGV